MSANPAFNPGAMLAVCRRQLSSLLGNPLGYVFILAFVLAAGACLFLVQGDRFFARNIADLQPLYEWMPLFLVVLLPALAMGTWALERELGTEEQLLTLPLSIADAILGKFLAVAVYFTLALVCSLSNVVVLMWLGTPDLGLVGANYLGWWLAGLVFAAFGVLASVLVSLPAVAFVIGAVFSALVHWSATNIGWFDAFQRGVFPLGNLVAAVAAILAALGTAVFLLASRRWRPAARATVVTQVLSLVFGLLLLANLSKLAGRVGIDADVTSEGLASISPQSRQILSGINESVTITAFISKDLPPDLAAKGKEVEDKLKALERGTSGSVKVVIHRPADALDTAGAMASREFNLKPRKVPVDTVTGRELNEVFLGAAISSGARTQLIEYFDPGLSVEYELTRAVRGVSLVQKKVLGISETDLNLNGNFDYQSGQMSQPWEIVEEWKRQYDVRPVNLDSAVAAEVEVLVVAQPSSLSQVQLEHLHQYIWSGRKTLLMEDPFPYFSVAQGRQDLIPGQPKRSANPMGQQQEGGPTKGDIKPLWKALGLDFSEEHVMWSDYNPSHQFRNLIPPSFVWTNRDLKGVKDGDATTGINSLLFPFPGTILAAKDKPAAMEVQPLISVVPGVPWGKDASSEMFERDFMGRFQLKEPKRRYAGDRTSQPAMAVAVRGTMTAAYPVEVPSATAGEVDKKSAIPGSKPVDVVVIADVDFVNNEFFNFYRNSGNRFGEDEMRFLLELRNVQLAANAVDALFQDRGFLDLRTRRPTRRPLERLEAQLTKTQDNLRATTALAESDAQLAIDQANEAFQKKLGEIDARSDIDENAKAHEKAVVQVRESRKLEVQLNEVNKKKDARIRDAKIDQRRAIASDRTWVKALAVAVPAGLLALLVLAVFANRVAAERAHIPASRKRQ